MLYLILSKFNLGELSLPWGSKAKMWSNSTEASGTFICSLILGYLLFAFITIFSWKAYPSWVREAGVLPPQENTPADQVEQSLSDIHTILRIWAENLEESMEMSQRCLRKVLLKMLLLSASYSLPGRGSQLQGFEFIWFLSCDNAFYYCISEKQSICYKWKQEMCMPLWVCGALWE